MEKDFPASKIMLNTSVEWKSERATRQPNAALSPRTKATRRDRC